MRNEFPGDEFKNIWQGQSTETYVMTLKLIRQKGRELHAKTRRKLMGTLVGPLAVACIYGFGVRVFPSLQHVLQPLFAIALLWSLAGLVLLNRGMWSETMPGDAALNTGLEFCRREVERRRSLLRRVLLWSFGPILLALATFILGLVMIGHGDMKVLSKGLPFMTLVAAWVVGIFLLRFREQRELQRDIEDLDDLAGENSRSV